MTDLPTDFSIGIKKTVEVARIETDEFEVCKSKIIRKRVKLVGEKRAIYPAKSRVSVVAPTGWTLLLYSS